MYQGNQQGDIRACRIVMERVVAAGLMASVFNGGDDPELEQSADINELMDALGETGLDIVVLYDALRLRLGSITLVWGNCPSGVELVSDYSWGPHVAEEVMENIVNLDQLDPDK
jgi:hypothetical protein